MAKQDGYESIFLNDFNVLEVLGDSCCVFKAENRNDGYLYVVKRISVQASEAKIKDALSEARALAKLEHSGIVRLNSAWLEEPPEKWQYKADEELVNRVESSLRFITNYKYDDVFIYIQMEFCNQSLESWLAVNQTESARPLAQIKHWFQQVVSAVAYIHEKGFIHRKLKPSNIMFVNEDRLKICDFEMATDQNLEDGEEVEASTARIETQMYMSPEQHDFPAKCTSKTDVFALGLIFAELFVVMAPSQRNEFFEYCRRGTPNLFIENMAVAEFVGTLTKTDPRDRPTCPEVLNLPFLS